MTPTPGQVRSAREAAGHTQAQAADLVHATRRAWQNWEATGTEGRPMPPAVWELYRLRAGQHPEWVLMARA